MSCSKSQISLAATFRAFHGIGRVWVWRWVHLVGWIESPHVWSNDPLLLPFASTRSSETFIVDYTCNLSRTSQVNLTSAILGFFFFFLGVSFPRCCAFVIRSYDSGVVTNPETVAVNRFDWLTGTVLVIRSFARRSNLGESTRYVDKILVSLLNTRMQSRKGLRRVRFRTPEMAHGAEYHTHCAAS